MLNLFKFEIYDESEFEKIISENQVVLCFFHNISDSRSQKSNDVYPKFESFSQKYTQIKFASIDVEKVNISSENIRYIPTFITYLMGKRFEVILETGDLEDMLLKVLEELDYLKERAHSNKSFTNEKFSEKEVWTILFIGEALKDYEGNHINDLSFSKGDMIEVRGIESEHWQNGVNLSTNDFGSFPSKFISQQDFGLGTSAFSSSNKTLEKTNTATKPAFFSPTKKLSTSNSNMDVTTTTEFASHRGIEKRMAPPLPERPKNSVQNANINNRDVFSKLENVEDSSEFIQNYDFLFADEYASNCPKECESSIKNLANYLGNFSEDPYYTCRVIYTWIALNIHYDVEGFLKGNIKRQDSESCLRSKTAVCSGYSQIFKSLCDELNIRCTIINGYGKGYGTSAGDEKIILYNGSMCNHAWCSVEINQDIFFIENTWGAGYFPKNFILNHFPEKKRYQYLEQNLSESEFLRLPCLKPAFFKLKCTLIKPRNFENHSDFMSIIEVSQPEEVFEIEIKVGGVKDEDENCLIVNFSWAKFSEQVKCLGQMHRKSDGFSYFNVKGICPEYGEGRLNIFERKNNEEVINFLIKNKHVAKNQNCFAQKFSSEIEFTLLKPIFNNLQLNQRYDFILKPYTKLQTISDKLSVVICFDGKVVNFKKDTVDGFFILDNFLIEFEGQYMVGYMEEFGEISGLYTFQGNSYNFLYK
ncbi:hypothetical protein HDU92_008986 [Lobulomyces angularis]|nr:hypothetical protein HDU92_008986 [Lobulomyces angularis]